MRNNDVLFLTSHLSRQLIAFAKQMGREGFDVHIAAPVNENLQYMLKNRFVRLVRIGRRLFGRGRIRNFGGPIVAFDDSAVSFAKKAKIPAIPFLDTVGIDLSIWSPKAISGNRQTMLLTQYNIQPHQKMLLLLDATDKDIKALIPAIQEFGEKDFIIALYGKMTRRTARKISRKIAATPEIIYLGNEQDLPSLMRASFAIMSLSDKKSFYKIAALAMGRTAAWKACEIRPNIVIKNNIADSLVKVLNLPADARERFEDENIKRAQNYSFEKNIRKLKNLMGLDAQ